MLARISHVCSLIAFIVLLALLPPAAGVDPSEYSPQDVGKSANPANITTTISGHIVDIATSLPLANALVEVYNNEGIEQSLDVRTDEVGFYEIQSLEPGIYFLRALAATYVTELHDRVYCSNNCSPRQRGTPIHLSEGEKRVVDFALKPGGGISGIVVDEETGQPLDVRVLVVDGTGATAASIRTGSAGEFVASGLDYRNYYLKITDDDYVDELYDDIFCRQNCFAGIGTPIRIEGDQVTSGITVSLTPGGEVSGVVTDAVSGLGMQARIEIYDLNRNQVASGSFSGEYAVGGLPTGDFYVFADSGQLLDQVFPSIPCVDLRCDIKDGLPVSVTQGGTTTGIDFALPAAASITVDSVTALTGGEVLSPILRVYDELGSVIGTGSMRVGDGVELTGLPAGDFFVRASETGFVAQVFDGIDCEGNCDVTVGTPITTVLGQSSGPAQFALKTAGSISGTVREDQSGLGVSFTLVVAYDLSGRGLLSAATDPEGRYSISGLAGGDYYVLARGWRHVDKLYDDVPFSCTADGCPVTCGALVSVVPGEDTPDINFNLEKGGLIEGKISIDDTGDVAPATSLWVFDTFGNSVIGFAFPFSDADGNYVVGGLPTGTYHVSANPLRPEQGLGVTLYGGVSCPRSTCDVTKGLPVSVVQGETTEDVDIALLPSEVIIYDGFD